jgi:predicted nucleic-acid-binding Zn-ribbon protein
MSDEEQRLAHGGTEFRCLVCGGTKFRQREIKMNTTGMSLFNLDFANRSAVGVICTACGFVHMFAGGKLAWEPR